MKICVLLFLVFMVNGAFSQTTPAPGNVEINKIKDYSRRLLLSDTAYATEQSYRLTDDIIYETDANGYFSALTPEGNWKDIEYKSQMRSAWRPSWHLYRTMLICREYYKNHNPAYLKAVHTAMSFWIKNDFVCENWWQNNINTPFTYLSLILMLGDDVLPQEKEFLDRVIVKRIPVHKATGQNLIWQLDNEARLALINNNSKAFSEIMQKMQGVIAVTVQEGIQPDYSFHQHGPMLQYGNYGMHFTNSLLFWMTITANTSVAFTPAKQQMIFDYVSKGLRWSIYKKSMDITAVGRQIRANSGLKRGENLAVNSRMIRSFDKGKACEYFIDGYRDQDQLNCKLEGNKSFWRSDYMIQRKADRYMMSVKMHGPFVSRIESINGENLKGAFLNDGVTLIQRSGKEYKNIEALWNWAMLPGTTGDTTVNPAVRPAFSTANKGVFTGQLSNGQEGIAAMDYDRIGIKARKSYFFNGDVMFAVGAGVQSAETKNIITVVDQKFYNSRDPLSKGVSSTGEKWLWTDSVAYFFPDAATEIKTKIENKQADWYDVDNASGHKAVSGSLFTAYIGHNKQNKYVYAIQPDIGLAETSKTQLSKRFTLLDNSAEVQAIALDQKVMAVFYTGASISFFKNNLLKVDQSCILILEKKNGKHVLWLSDPTRKLEQVKVTLNGTSKIIAFPLGDDLGSTIQIVL